MHWCVLQRLITVNDIEVYDDFAHHPTAIESTLAGVKNSDRFQHIWAVIEPRSNTMRMGVHKQALPTSVKNADTSIWFQPKGLDWDMQPVIDGCREIGQSALLMDEVDAIIAHLVENAKAGDVIVLMSNGGFAGIHQQLAQALKDKYGA